VPRQPPISADEAPDDGLTEGYRQMAADREGELEAAAWVAALIADIAEEPC
jgi:hypothetical protein